MDFAVFKTSLSGQQPPDGLSLPLQALWWDGKGHWEKAHDLINELHDRQSAWVHAYLHRKEGDLWNADYWYRQAQQQRPVATLESEWESLVRQLL